MGVTDEERGACFGGRQSATTELKSARQSSAADRAWLALMRLACLVLVLIGSAAGAGKEPGERQLDVLRRKVAVSADGSSAAEEKATVVVAAGCFWGVELAFARLPGVLATEVGYTGGVTTNPTYQTVSSGATRHAEAVRVTYDAAIISLGDLLRVFYDIHDPTTVNRQGNDVGTQYRSAIFYADAEQRGEAEKALVDESLRRGHAGVVTTIEPLKEFTPAEDYHRARAPAATRDAVPCARRAICGTRYGSAWCEDEQCD